MLAIPLPFITVFLLMLFSLRLRKRGEKRGKVKIETLFIAASALSITLTGVHWGTDLALPPFMQPIVAAAIPPLLWLCLTASRAKPGEKRNRYQFTHLLSIATVMVFAAMNSLTRLPLIDVSLAVIYSGYGAALIYVSSPRSARADEHAGGWSNRPFRAGLCVIISAIADAAIALDLNIDGGKSAPHIVASAHIVMLMILTFLIVTQDMRRTAHDNGAPPVSANKSLPAADDRELMDKLDQFMRQTRLYADPNLTLPRLARRMAIPA